MKTLLHRVGLSLVAITLATAACRGAAVAQQVVGAVGAANASPSGRAPGRAVRLLTPGADIFFKDHILTRRGGSAQLVFLDRSTLNVGENSDVVIDEFVYRPGEGGAMSATLTKGVLRFVGGDISHNGGTTVKTPVVTIGIRGGIGTIGYVKDAAGLQAIPGAPPDFHGGTIVVNGYGTLTVRNGADEVVLSRPGFALFVGSASERIGAPVRLDMATAQAMMKTLTSRSSQHGGASATGTAAIAGLGKLIDIPVAVVQAQGVNALDFTSVISAGNALAGNQAQARQAVQLRQQLVTMQVAAAPTAQVTTSSPPAPSAPPATGPATATPSTTAPVARPAGTTSGAPPTGTTTAGTTASSSTISSPTTSGAAPTAGTATSGTTASSSTISSPTTSGAAPTAGTATSGTTASSSTISSTTTSSPTTSGTTTARTATSSTTTSGTTMSSTTTSGTKAPVTATIIIQTPLGRVTVYPGLGTVTLASPIGLFTGHEDSQGHVQTPFGQVTIDPGARLATITTPFGVYVGRDNI